MKKKILALFGGLITLALVVNVASAAMVTVGNDDTSRTVTDTRADFVIIDTNNPASSNARLDSFEYYASSTNHFHFLIVDSSDQVKWVSEEIGPDATGQQEYIPLSSVFIKTGWNIGMYFISTGTIPFDYAGAPAWYTLGGYGLPSAGDTLTFQNFSNRIYSFVASGTELPYGVITSPDEDEKVYGTLDLAAEYYDGDEVNDDIVQWAVRKDTCSAATNTVFGNVDGHSDSFSWDGKNFSSSLDVSSTTPGYYCFIFNPKDDTGETDVRETRWFYIVDGYVGGGGQIIEEIGPKPKDNHKISFGGAVYDVGSAGYMGEWEVNFHNVGIDEFDQSKFHSTDIRVINFYNGSGTCNEAMNMTMFGEWNGAPNYKMIFRAGSYGAPGKFTETAFDTVRVELFDPGGVRVYDTRHQWGQEFTNQSTCVGGSRTGLDHGNITIWH